MVRHSNAPPQHGFSAVQPVSAYLTKMLSQLAVKNIPAVFRDEYNTIFALPSAVV
jgi:hypothetical protein